MNCVNCGNPLDGTTKICPHCGQFNDLNQVQPVQNNVVPNQQPPSQNSGNNKTLLIIALVSIIVILVVVVIIVLTNSTGDNSNNQTTTTNGITSNESTTTEKATMGTTEVKYTEDIDITGLTLKPEDTREESKNIELVKIFKDDSSSTSKHIYLVFKNNNDKTVDVRFYLNYYKEGVRVDSNDGYSVTVAPGKVAIDDIHVKTKEEFDNYDITLKTSKINSYYKTVEIKDNSIQKVSMEANNIYGMYTNNNDVSVTGHGICLYYKGNELVYAQSGYLGEVKPGENKGGVCYSSLLPKNIEFDNVVYDLYNLYYIDGE